MPLNSTIKNSLTAVTEILNTLQEEQTVRVALPRLDREDHMRLCGVYQGAKPPCFTLLFPENNQQLSDIDKRKKCAMMIDRAGKTISLIANIKEIKNNQTIIFSALKTINHEQSRNYFRVDVNTPLVASSIMPEKLAGEGTSWRLTGETIDVSGCGLLASFTKPVKEKQQIRLDLVLPTSGLEVIQTVAHAVRVKKIKNDRYQVAFQFDRISQEDKDKIMGCCFKIQRKNLRLKVQVNNLF